MGPVWRPPHSVQHEVKSISNKYPLVPLADTLMSYCALLAQLLHVSLMSAYLLSCPSTCACRNVIEQAYRSGTRECKLEEIGPAEDREADHLEEVHLLGKLRIPHRQDATGDIRVAANELCG